MVEKLNLKKYMDISTRANIRVQAVAEPGIQVRGSKQKSSYAKEIQQ